MQMKVLLMMAALSGCTTVGQPKVELSAAKGLLAANSTYVIVCDTGLTQALKTGVLVGAKYNKAKAACIEADVVLDAAQDAYTAGQLALAASKVTDALDRLSAIDEGMN